MTFHTPTRIAPGAYARRGHRATTASRAGAIGVTVALVLAAGVQGAIPVGASLPPVDAAGARAYVSPQGADRNRCDTPATPRALRSAEIYDPHARRWALTAPMRVGRGNHTATLLADGRVLVAGGAERAQASALDAEPGVLAADLYDVRKGTWTAAGVIVPRMIRYDGGFHSAVRLSTGDVLLANPSWTEQDVALYTPRTHSWSAPSASPLAFHTGVMFATLNDGRLLATGGQTESTGTVDVGGDSAVYDAASGRWAVRAHLPRSVSYGAAVTLRDGRVLVVGGTTGATASAAVQEYTPQTDTWREVRPMRRAHGPGVTATVLRDGRVLVIGDGTGGEIYSPAGR